MTEELNEITTILNKIFPKILKEPQIMRGCDVSEEEIELIKEKQKISLRVMEHLAGDEFFNTYYDEFGINNNEAKEVTNFLFNSAKYFLDE